ncbi:hypothetical protein Ae406Ps2_3791c [Pseudonocardia sp. Ae406_Ps2]|nr:hypothetical protein Ae331Ps2_2149 [Pseudonocardia sp. Ae331_Ps2]OLM03791.1 hypothetical protein Ae406Ps2_3791c [Pseudonocardia sp. Ae406_Ps2]OLM25347.1 hypothetical protein Ae706Ps2_3780c [Pseudonocardia sp. Ae706_Ps2]
MAAGGLVIGAAEQDAQAGGELGSRLQGGVRVGRRR